MARPLTCDEKFVIDTVSGKNDPMFSTHHFVEVPAKQILFDDIVIMQDPREKLGDWMKTLVCAHERFTDAWMIAEFDNHVDYVPPLATLFSRDFVDMELKKAYEKGYKSLSHKQARNVASNYGVSLGKPMNLPDYLLEMFHGNIRIVHR